MLSPHKTWLAYVTCVLLVAAAVGWLSLRALESERSEREGRRQAELEENVRLALWRMDSAMSPFVAQQSATPVLSFSPALSGSPPGLLVESASAITLALPQVEQVRLYFQVSAKGAWSSPQIPCPPEGSSDAPPGTPLHVAGAQARLERLRGAGGFEQLREVALPLTESSVDPQVALGNSPQMTQELPQPQSTPPALAQRARGASEFNVRSQYVIANNTVAANSNREGVQSGVLRSSESRAGSMAPAVLQGELLLVRRALVDGESVVQGCWLDWNRLRDDLLGSITDLLPQAELSIVASPDQEEQGRRLASLPVRLDPGPAPTLASDLLSPVRQSLFVAWGGMLLAAAAVAALLQGVLALSERRADFVSAVTHELRTPLTTFRMYAEMLAEGMVPDEARRRDYLKTLQVEAIRLTHLVENVLAYARLERGGLGNRLQPTAVEELLATATSRLRDRAEQARLMLTCELADAHRSLVVWADPSAVEQILFNLVDNACKYASGGDDRRVEISTQLDRDRFCIRVRDHGPGLPVELRTHLFQPFRKSAEAAASTAPGVGLGLSLSRRLARDMRGDLTHIAAVTDGAAFELRLRTCRATAAAP
ncbi:MAG: sensor histidine kinase [Planctomycetales bacterium]